jgi:hypothetical protein
VLGAWCRDEYEVTFLASLLAELVVGCSHHSARIPVQSFETLVVIGLRRTVNFRELVVQVQGVLYFAWEYARNTILESVLVVGAFHQCSYTVDYPFALFHVFFRISARLQTITLEILYILEFKSLAIFSDSLPAHGYYDDVRLGSSEYLGDVVADVAGASSDEYFRFVNKWTTHFKTII